jgi:adenylate cyclase
MVPAVTRRGGMVNKFTGDGLLAVFGAPLGQGESQDAHAAIAAAQEIQASLEALNQQLLVEGAPAMRMRIGVHSGLVLAGSMGSSERLEYAVLGDAVNCASRLESLEKARQHNTCRVLVSGSTRALLLQDDLRWEAWGELQVKGRQEPLQVWELLGPATTPELNAGSARAAPPASRP